MNCSARTCLLALQCWATLSLVAEEVGERWGTAEHERAYYRVVNVPIPKGLVVEAGAFEQLPDGRLAVGTRRGDIYLLDDVDAEKPSPKFKRFATGLDEIFGEGFSASTSSSR